MERKQSLLVFDRREMALLWLIGVVLAIFAFTLGVHFGKHLITSGGAGRAPVEPNAIETVGDLTPTRQELAEQAKGVPEAMDESLNRALHEEVTRTGVKLDQSRQVELPRNAKSKSGGATTLTETATETAPEEHAAPATHQTGAGDAPAKLKKDVSHAISHATASYAIQVGSFPELALAKSRLQSMEAKGLKPQLKVVEIPGKGTWYRIFLSGYDSHESADAAGKKFREEHLIDSYIVSKHE